MKKIRINNECSDYFRSCMTEGSSDNLKLEIYLSSITSDNEISFNDNAEKFKQMINNENKFFFFIGHPNTGKTAFLKKYFDIRGNLPFIDENHRRFLLPIMGKGDSEDKTPYENVTESIRGLCDRIEYEYDQVEQSTMLDTERFYQFIVDTRIDYLPELTFSEKSKLTSYERKCARIDKMQKEYRLAFQLSRLKFYLLNFCHDIKELVIVLDNIQNIYSEIDKQKEMVYILLEAFECMGNCGRDVDAPWKTYIIVSIRPYNYRMIKENDKILSYARKKVWNENKINSANLFSRVLGRDISDTSKERLIGMDSLPIYSSSFDFGEALLLLSGKFGHKYATMIEKLCFYNMDLMMQAYKRILLNQTWVREEGFAFTSDVEGMKGLAFNNITCIRALACGEDKVYRRWENLSQMAEIDKLIPNILYNEENKEYGIINLYTMKYYLRHFNSNMEWGETYIVLENYVDTICTLLDIDLQTCIFSTNYLLQREVLRRSVHDVEGVAGLPYNQYLGSKNKLYITSRGTQLWDMFRDDSVLLELCREDMYLDDDMNEDAQKSSYELMMEKKQPLLFIFLLNIIEYIFNEEFEYFKNACREGKRDSYREAFGRQPMSLILLEGITKSIQYSGCHSVMRKRNELETNIITKWREWVG